VPFAADTAADDALLRQFLTDLAQERDLEQLLQLVVTRLAALPSVALARIWLIAPGDICPSCPMAGECPSRERCLHLVASGGRPRNAAEDWSRRDGGFRRFPLAVRKIGRIATSNQHITIPDVRAESQWIARPEWVRAEGIIGFSGKPLAVRDAVVGVLGVFTRVPFDPAMCEMSSLLAHHAAISIGNARAFAEVDRLRRAAEAENEQLRAELSAQGSFGEIIGSSPLIRAVTSRIALVAPTPANVLITGESGTGKELVARELHRRSTRHAGPLVRVNCAAIPGELFESEFFGHVRGSFTGATADRLGRFAAADGGTILLDEVGEIPLALQGKLLRVLQEGTYERIGDDRARHTDVRVLAATNRDLQAEVAAGRFREDLFYRLNVVPIHLPPLRARRQDIGPIALHLLQRLAHRCDRETPRLTRGDLDKLEAHDWPGNIRELANRLERAMITGSGDRLALDLLPPAASATMQASATDEVLDEAGMVAFERRNLQRALERCGGRIFGATGAAALLGLKPTTLLSRLQKHGIARGR
jgi:transcriptional regulator with GAF, ATPase, and Fis domain